MAQPANPFEVEPEVTPPARATKYNRQGPKIPPFYLAVGLLVAVAAGVFIWERVAATWDRYRAEAIVEELKGLGRKRDKREAEVNAKFNPRIMPTTEDTFAQLKEDDRVRDLQRDARVHDPELKALDRRVDELADELKAILMRRPGLEATIKYLR